MQPCKVKCAETKNGALFLAGVLCSKKQTLIINHRNTSVSHDSRKKLCKCDNQLDLGTPAVSCKNIQLSGNHFEWIFLKYLRGNNLPEEPGG